VEKLDYLLWDRADDVRAVLDCDGVRALTLQVADDTLPQTLVLGDGPRLAALACVWLSSYDLRGAVEDVLRGATDRLDGYLVTESEPQPDVGERAGGVSHVTWFPKPERLTEDEFLRGWHEVHTRHSAELHPRRWSYVRDTAVRALTAGSPPVRAIVVERFAVEDYGDPRRLFGSKAALDQNVRDLPGYADLADVSCRPMRQVVLR
jgi:hypothetical protein